MLCHGHESWHPDPAFYYSKFGGGPLMDMGPYYLTDLVSLIGGIRRVTGSARVTFPDADDYQSKPKHGTVIEVETPTHLSAVLDFASGAVGTLVTSFDVWAHQMPHIEIYGTEGSLKVPDPNGFGGKVQVKRKDETEWRDVETNQFQENGRGVGVADMAAAIEGNRPHRASGGLAFHVLDVMQGVLDSSASGTHYIPVAPVERPAAFPTGLPENSVEIQ